MAHNCVHGNEFYLYLYSVILGGTQPQLLVASLLSAPIQVFGISQPFLDRIFHVVVGGGRLGDSDSV